eukprot:281337-Pleurochrysis_carterae.AAC.1
MPLHTCRASRVRDRPLDPDQTMTTSADSVDSSPNWLDQREDDAHANGGRSYGGGRGNALSKLS